MAYKLNIATREITQVPKSEAETAMRNYGYQAKTINRLSREATIFYTGGAFYSRDRFRLDEEVRENTLSAPSPYETWEVQGLSQLSERL